MKIILILGFFIFSLQSILSAPKKIYLMELRSNDENKAKEFRKLFKQAFIKEKNYELIDEDTIKDLNEKLKKLQMYGCDETRCLQEISNSFGADEIISGDLKVLATQYFVNLKVTKRDSDTFEVGIKTNIQKSFYEQQNSYYIKEFIKTIENPSYTINDSNAPPIGQNLSYTKILPVILPEKPPTFKFIEFSKSVETWEDTLNLYIATGDSFFAKKNYSEAKKHYKLGLDYSFSKSLISPINIYERLDACDIYPLYEAYPTTPITGSKSWKTGEMETNIIPEFTNYKNKFNLLINSPLFKNYYDNLKEVTDTNLALLLSESLNLLYSSNRLDEYMTRFKFFETYLSENKIRGNEQTKFINDTKQKEVVRKNTIEKDYIPAWNNELRRDCTTIYVSAKVMPYLQLETGENYENTLNSLRVLSSKIKERLVSGKGAINQETEIMCSGMLR